MTEEVLLTRAPPVELVAGALLAVLVERGCVCVRDAVAELRSRYGSIMLVGEDRLRRALRLLAELGYAVQQQAGSHTYYCLPWARPPVSGRRRARWG